jgi:isopenicillin N synthase-like dioxygenase
MCTDSFPSRHTFKFASRHLLQRHKIDEASKTTVRLLHSPPVQSANGNGRDAKRPARLLLGHTDNVTLAVLFNALGGYKYSPLFLSPNDDKNCCYIRPVPNCAVVNVGDALWQWSGGILRSGIHRVVSPPGEQAINQRLSFVYVLKPGSTVSMSRLVGGEEDDRDGLCKYEDWLKVKSRVTAEGRSVVHIRES